LEPLADAPLDLDEIRFRGINHYQLSPAALIGGRGHHTFNQVKCPLARWRIEQNPIENHNVDIRAQICDQISEPRQLVFGGPKNRAHNSNLRENINDSFAV
jgi:hypothetical protein